MASRDVPRDRAYSTPKTVRPLLSVWCVYLQHVLQLGTASVCGQLVQAQHGKPKDQRHNPQPQPQSQPQQGGGRHCKNNGIGRNQRDRLCTQGPPFARWDIGCSKRPNAVSNQCRDFGPPIIHGAEVAHKCAPAAWFFMAIQFGVFAWNIGVFVMC